jgi:phenylalanyl-tRNA synthetase beta chain
MPTIDIHKQDLEELVGRKFTVKELEEALTHVKGEIEDVDGHNIKIEIKSTDRPDLWNVEGLARQLRAEYTKNQGIPKYKFKNSEKYFINVSEKVKSVRPYIGAFVCKGINIDDFSLKQLIQAQEKIAGTFGRKRREVAIGIFELDNITWPLLYTAESPEKIKFEPLDGNRDMDLNEILKIHPKGIEYGHLVKKFSRYPILIDANDKVVSFPPIINSEYSGRVTTKTKNLLVEITGLEMKNVEVALNIFAMSLADRGGKIEQVTVTDSEKNSIITPIISEKYIEVPKELIHKTFGEKLLDKTIKNLLDRSRYDYETIPVTDSGNIKVKYPSYRVDIMHPIDVVEDLVMSYGYSNLVPEYPTMNTIGSLLPHSVRQKKLRTFMAGTGAQEISTFLLTNKDTLFSNMNCQEDNIVEILNPVSYNYSVFRNWLIPSVVEFLSKNTKVEYPQKVFEYGKVIELNKKKDVGTEDINKLVYAESSKDVTFTNVKSVLITILSRYNKTAKFVSKDYPSFIPGRSAEVIIDGKSVGLIGELSPSVLSNWKIEMPVAIFEIKNIID